MEKNLVSGNNVALQEALKDLPTVSTEKQWARVVVSRHMIAIYYGAIHPYFGRECAIGSVSYFPQSDGTVMKVQGRHCG